ncbi:MAG TPA: hypothetical protein VKQ52_10975 [Puia sp.]|nr:hypothetical protein [Puia sp.]
MSIDNSVSLMTRLAELKHSTTLFLESIRGEYLKVLLESQAEVWAHSNTIIERVTRLYFDSSDLPVLYCTSHLNKSNLTVQEYTSLAEGLLPLGIVFHRYNHAHSIKKTNVVLSEEINRDIARSLNVTSPLIFQKRYDYWVGDRQIGYICEFFNEESLDRV